MQENIGGACCNSNHCSVPGCCTNCPWVGRPSGGSGTGAAAQGEGGDGVLVVGVGKTVAGGSAVIDVACVCVFVLGGEEIDAAEGACFIGCVSLPSI